MDVVVVVVLTVVVIIVAFDSENCSSVATDRQTLIERQREKKKKTKERKRRKAKNKKQTSVTLISPQGGSIRGLFCPFLHQYYEWHGVTNRLMD